MTIFEEYSNSRSKEIKLKMDYLCSFHNYRNHMYDLSNTRNDLYTCTELLKEFDEAQVKRKSIGEKICDLSFISFTENTILCKFLKFVCGEEYELKRCIIGNWRKILLIKKGASLDFRMTTDNLLTNESIIVLTKTACSELGGSFNLYQHNDKNADIYCEIEDNVYFNETHNDAKVLKEFIDMYIIAKSKREDLSLEDYFENYLVNYLRQTSNEEGLLEHYDDAYKEHDKEEQRRSKRSLASYYHKEQRKSKNQAIAKRKLEQLPNKYMLEEDISTLTFIRKIELMIGRHFSSIEKDTIKSWLILGFDEDVIIKAYNEASIRGNYNASVVANILRDLITFEQKENNVKNMMLTKDMKKQ